MNNNKKIQEKTGQYRTLTQTALHQIKLHSHLTPQQKKIADDFLQMARNYFADAKHFETQNDLVTALAAYSYAHAWLDAGVRAGFFDAQHNNHLFTLP